MIEQAAAQHLFHQQQRKNMVSHAYLIVGKSDAFAFAEYMAQSLMCPVQEIGACGTCTTCLRIKEKNHGNYRVIQGADESIKKDDIVSLKDYFIQTAMEAGGHKVYIVDHVETASISALNSVLKFLEEPDSDITAILTTDQPNRVLETVRSRCQSIQLQEKDHEHLSIQAQEAGLDAFDALLLSSRESKLDELLTISESESYRHVSDLIRETHTLLSEKRIHEAIVQMQHEGIKNKKLDKETIGLFLDGMIVTMSFDTNQTIDFDDRIKYKQLFMNVKDRLGPGINVNLLIDQMGYELIQMHKGRSL